VIVTLQMHECGAGGSLLTTAIFGLNCINNAYICFCECEIDSAMNQLYVAEKIISASLCEPDVGAPVATMLTETAL